LVANKAHHPKQTGQFPACQGSKYTESATSLELLIVSLFYAQSTRRNYSKIDQPVWIPARCTTTNLSRTQLYFILCISDRSANRNKPQHHPILDFFPQVLTNPRPFLSKTHQQIPKFPLLLFGLDESEN
jgi:hypothetical protein